MAKASNEIKNMILIHKRNMYSRPFEAKEVNHTCFESR